MNHKENFVEERFASFDANGDGKITPTELTNSIEKLILIVRKHDALDEEDHFKQSEKTFNAKKFFKEQTLTRTLTEEMKKEAEKLKTDQTK